MLQDEAIEDVIKEILDGADLETVTMKNVCNQVCSAFILSFLIFSGWFNKPWWTWMVIP